MKNGTCVNCGGELLGDGFRTVLHCERLDMVFTDKEPDSKPVYCTDEVDDQELLQDFHLLFEGYDD